MTRRELWTSQTSGFDSFIMGMEASAARPQGKDPVIQAIGMACVEEATKPYLRSLVEAGLNHRGPLIPPNAAGLGRVALIQKPILFPDPRNPYEMTDEKDPFAALHWRGHPRPKAAKKLLRQLYDPDSSEHPELVEEAREEAAEDMSKKFVGTTDEDRYVLPMVAAAIIHRQIPGYFNLKAAEGIDIVDLGCGNNYGLRWIGARSRIVTNRPQPPKVQERQSPKHRRGYTKFKVDPLLSQAISMIWNSAPALGVGLGIDIMDSRERDIIRWRASSRYPKEYIRSRNNPEYTKIEQDDFVSFSVQSNVLFRPGDITRISMQEARDALGDYQDEIQRFHMGITSTVLYEMTVDEQIAAIKNMQHMAQLGVLQDFGRVDIRNRGRLIITDKSFGTPNTFITAVGNLETEEAKFYEWFVSDSGRVNNTQLGQDFGWFNGEQIFTEADLRRLVASPGHEKQGRRIFA